MQRVVVIGGGFGGLNAARSLRRAACQVTLVDRRNFHLFQPLLYQVATGGLSPANIAAPLRAIFRRQRNLQILMGEATDIDVAGRRVTVGDQSLPYDTLVVAAGGRPSYFGHDDWPDVAPSLKTVEDATEIRSRILSAFEAAERSPDVESRQGWLTFVLVGAGPTGVELAGALGELAHHTLRDNFRVINPADARILLIEGEDRVLPTYPTDLSAKAQQSLGRLGATVWTSARVMKIEPDHVVIHSAIGDQTVATRTVIWTAGVRAESLAGRLAAATGNRTDHGGRLIVEPDFTLAGHPEVFVIGDMASYPREGQRPLPGVAPVAIQAGCYVARVIESRIRGKSPPKFTYKDRGDMATIGRGAAVADLRWVQFSGYPAWWAWLLIHLLNIVDHESRLLVLVQWAWNYVTRNRAARLITGQAGSAATTTDGAKTPDDANAATRSGSQLSTATKEG
ncbi:MAG: NAD(P)/FAD-dependent oxidoreductase [Pirellulales bacterium]